MPVILTRLLVRFDEVVSLGCVLGAGQTSTPAA